MNQRLSNIELLRCLSMFMVLLLHSSFMVYGMPDSLEINKAPGFWGGKILQQGLGIVAVYKAKNHKHLQLFISNILFEVFKSDYLFCIRKSTL